MEEKLIENVTETGEEVVKALPKTAKAGLVAGGAALIAAAGALICKKVFGGKKVYEINTEDDNEIEDIIEDVEESEE